MSSSTRINGWDRRSFLQFMGRSIVGTAATASSASLILSQVSCAGRTKSLSKALPFVPLIPSSTDEVGLAKGFQFKRLITWGDQINKVDTFGTHSDYIAFVPVSDRDPSDAILWNNHESVDPKFASGFYGSMKRTRAQVDKEQLVVGGSLVRIRRNSAGQWEVIPNDNYNRRLNAKTPIPFSKGYKIAGRTRAIGTLANCAGGITPWQTVLTCEENYDDFYGEVEYANNRRRKIPSSMFKWDLFYDYPPEHYGWVVEVNPFTGAATKLVALGRFAHEGATVAQLSDGRCVVYMGDDSPDQCIYKFVASRPQSLQEGELFVANLERGEWVSLKHSAQKILKQKFKDQTDVLIRTREAAKWVGGTPCDRPEDIEIDPITGDIFIALTNNKKKGNFFGSILRIKENDRNYGGLRFTHETFLTGGKESKIACPDNMVFDAKGNLWLASDVSGFDMNKAPYSEYKNNGLFYVPLSGSRAGQVFQVASAPVDAEFTGPCFSLDRRTLFLSVQHPGERSELPAHVTSHWPNGPKDVPRSAVIAIEGPALDALVL